MASSPCPSAQELIRKIKSLTRKDGTFQSAWKDSFPSSFHCCEQGGFIYVDFPVPPKLTKCYVARAPKGDTMNQRACGPNATIDLNKPGIKQNNVVLVANFHTHPLSQTVGGDQEPSRPDRQNAYHRGVPGIVVSRTGLWVYGPNRRLDTSTEKLKVYPGPVTPPGIPPATKEKAPPPPSVVKTQWPEGTANLHANVEKVEEGEDDTSEGDEELEDVIVLEWRDEEHVNELMVEDSMK